jgi:hypothetical protein
VEEDTALGGGADIARSRPGTFCGCASGGRSAILEERTEVPVEISKPRIRVIVADDSATVRLGVKAMLATCPDFEVVGEARTGLDVLRLVDTRRPDRTCPSSYYLCIGR